MSFVLILLFLFFMCRSLSVDSGSDYINTEEVNQ